MIHRTSLSKEIWRTKYQYNGETQLGTQIRVARSLAEVERKYGATDEEVESWFEIFLMTLVKFEPVSPLVSYVNDEDIWIRPSTGEHFRAIGLKCTGGGRITANIGTDFYGATLLNCFINYGVQGAKISYDRSTPDGEFNVPVEIQGSEESRDDLVNIFVSLLEAALTLAKEGGYGSNFDYIRPRGTPIGGTGVRHPGVVAYLEIWSKVADIIVRGDQDGYLDKLTNHLTDEEKETLNREVMKAMARKGAMMANLSIDHPDIEEFVRAKQRNKDEMCKALIKAGYNDPEAILKAIQYEDKLSKFNMSPMVSDEFMLAVVRDEMFDLKFEGVVYKRIRARDLWELMMECSYNRNEPGVIFEGNMNRFNPLLYMGAANASNPCIASDNWIMTSEGPRQVKDLVGKKFTAIVDGVPFESYKEGFFSSGVKDVYRVKTKRGYSVRITHDHELFKIEEGVSKKTPLNELEVGDMIALSNQRENASWSGEGTFDEGWLLGVLVGDGTFHRNSATDSACLDFWGDHKDDMVEKVNKIFEAHPELSPRNGNYNEDQDRVRIASKGLERLAAKFGIVRGNKTVTREVEQASSDFYKGFLQGFFDTDGSPQGTVSSGASVRLSQSDLPCLEGVQRMLARFGIMSKVYANRRDAQIKPMPDGKGGLKEYSCRAQHELVIPRDNMFLFKEMVDFSNVDKKVRLDNILSQYGERGPYPENFRDEIVLIEQEGSEEVFDCTIHNAHQLDASGLRIANCGETPGNPYVTTVCLLGSINLTQYVNQDRSFDFDTYKEDIQVFARMLENVNDIGNCPLPHYQWALENVRQYGMGLNGLGSALFMMGERYGSDNSLELVAEFGRIREDITWRQSALLAKERGPAPAFRESFFETPYFKELCQASEDTKELMRKYGLRNLKTSLNPPLGNTSGLCDAISNGIEPAFYFNYDRTFILDVWPEGLNADNVRDILREKEVAGNVVWEGEYNGKFYYYEPSNRGLCGVERQRDYGYAWVEEHYPEDIENGADYLVTAQDLSVMDHLNVQIEVQKYVNQSVSKTVNLPADYPYEDFKELYLKAWQGGLVGFTTYRAGTMESVLSTDKASEGTYKDLDFLNALKDNECISEVAEITDEGVIVNGVRVPESFDNGPTHVIKREGNKYYLHFSHLANCREHPLALWIYSNNMQEGEYVSLNRGVRKLQKLLVDKGVEVDLVLDQVEKLKGCPHCERLGKMISMCLRHNIKIPTIIQTLEGIEEDYISSTLTAVRKFLATAVKDGTKKEGVTCPDCGSSEVVFESGCGRCLTCGSSGCG